MAGACMCLRTGISWGYLWIAYGPWISNYIPHPSMGCNYTYMPENIASILNLTFQIKLLVIWDAMMLLWCHDDVIKWKHFRRYWPFVQGIHWSPVNSPHKGQWCGSLMFSLICVWINGWVNNREAGDLRCYHAHYDFTAMSLWYGAKT